MRSFIFAFLMLTCCKLSAQNGDSTKLPSTVQIDSVYEKVDVEAQFPGGEKKWNKFIQKIMRENVDNFIKDESNKGTCIIRFIVDVEGNISAARAVSMESSALAKTILKEIQNGPKWIPAKFNGTIVKSVREVKVTLNF